MASAEEYASWIVANPDKRGTPEFETVARAYQLARTSAPKQATPEDPTSPKNLLGAAVEPNLSLLSGMVATPIAGLAGIFSGGDADTVRRVSNTLTYEPKTIGGQNAAAVIGAPFEALSKFAQKGGEVASDVMGPGVGAAVNTLIQAAPMALGGPSALSSMTGKTSRSLMQSALKPTLADIQKGNAAQAVQTMLDEGLNVSPGGAAKLSDRVVSVNDAITDAIVNSQGRVNKNAVAGRLHDVVGRVEKQVNPASDVAAVEKAWNEFSDHPLIPGQDMSVQLAQEMKKNTYKGLKDKYGQLGSADVEAQKALARGLKEEIASAVPEVGPLNARESSLLSAQNILDRRVGMSANANPLGLPSIAPSAVRMVAGLLDRSDIVKSLLARALNPGKLSVSDQGALGATGGQTFDDDMKARKAIIAALLGA